VWFHTFLQYTGESVALSIDYSVGDILDDDLPYQKLSINAIMLYTEPAKYI
jgi:hypothetical protein